jgi:hypothetical protein
MGGPVVSDAGMHPPIDLSSPTQVTGVLPASHGGTGSPGTTVQYADEEVLSPVPDGVNKTFTLLNAPNPAKSLQLSNAGLWQHSGVGNDFTLTGNAIVFAVAPVLNAPLLAWYRY